MDWDGLGTATNHVAAERRLRSKGWSPCGAGDWAIALASPDGALAARISPFDPTGPMTVDLYRRAGSTGRVPHVLHHTRLEGGGDLLVMEHLFPTPVAQASRFLADVASEAPPVRDLVAILRRVHSEGAASLPWCGPLDTNPANVMRRHDGALVLTDPFYADGPNLYSAVLEDPERVARLIPPQDRRYITEVPLTGSGPWPDGEQDRMRTALAAADATLYGN
ncbi:MAG TPA: hypothetical protein VM143_02390 [Acidimicrobiales bacterium]|nr:hypothetical protein [Acidimicrobiales bacterium]